MKPRALLIIAILCGFGWLVTGFLNPHAALLAYLSAFLPLAEISLGALFILMLGFLVPGRWFEPLWRPLAAAALTMPVIALLFLPILFGLPTIYEWAAHPEMLKGFKAAYLSLPVFVIRNLFYFSLWTLQAFLLVRARGDVHAQQRAASWGLVVYALTGSIAGVDWIESLTLEFHSSTYGLLFLASQVLAGMSFAMAAIPALNRNERPLLLHGQLLFSCVLLWAYLHGMQYIIIWAANKPSEVQWYIDRSVGGWALVTWFVYLSQFLFPFGAFLFARVRRSIDWLIALALSFLFIRVVESFWLVVPGQEVNYYVLVPAAIFSLLFCGIVFWLSFLSIVARLRRGEDVMPSSAARSSRAKSSRQGSAR
ncbi:MAG TPA: hypothetical protein VHD34_02295 [Xanthobacteraceae bacterium]|nr:hypothetical protein [Xanthobacteraceae bacterium]